MKVIKFKELTVEKINKTFSNIENDGSVDYNDFVDDKTNEISDPGVYIRFRHTEGELQVSVREQHYWFFKIIPVTLVKGDEDTYKEFLRIWELIRVDRNTPVYLGNRKPVTSMMGMNLSTVMRFIELMYLGLHTSSVSLLTGTTLDTATKLGIYIDAERPGMYNINLSLGNNNYKTFVLDITVIENFINNWNRFRSENF